MNNEKIDDQKYIEELEGLVHFLSNVYCKLKDTYFDSHMKTCDITNPNRRDLTECEEKEWLRFSLIQGTKSQKAIESFSENKKPLPENIDKILNRYLEKN